MKRIDEEIARLDAEITRLQGLKDGLVLAKSLMTGEPSGTPEPRRRSANIKPLILDIMKAAGTEGRTTAEVDAIVKERVPTVAKDTVGSVLSRLKADNALVHDGTRYYDARYAPKPAVPFEPRVVS